MTEFFSANGARLCRRPAAARGQCDRPFKFAVLRLVEDDTAALRACHLFPLRKSNENKHLNDSFCAPKARRPDELIRSSLIPNFGNGVIEATGRTSLHRSRSSYKYWWPPQYSYRAL